MDRYRRTRFGTKPLHFVGQYPSCLLAIMNIECRCKLVMAAAAGRCSMKQQTTIATGHQAGDVCSCRCSVAPGGWQCRG